MGTVLGGKYRVKRLLGTGGMGSVYKAENTTIGRTVAVKVLHPHLSDDGVALTRFQREARAAAGMQHPHVVQVLDMGVDDGGAPFIVMEYVRGKSAAQLLRLRGAIAPKRAAHIVGQVLDALEQVHSRGIIHRDLKPENVLLTVHQGREDFAKIFDFGVAAFIESAWDARGPDLTPTGRTMGTPYYASPEQLLGERGHDARVDLYACGVLLYELVTGERPFQAGNFADLCKAITDTDAPPMRVFRQGIPAPFEDLVRRALAKEADDRFADAAAMRDALVPFGAPPRVEDAPEPTDTFTIDLRELRARERELEYEPPPRGAGVLHADVAGVVVEVLQARVPDATLAELQGELGVMLPTKATGWVDDGLLHLLEVADERVGTGERRLVADVGRRLAELAFDTGLLPGSVPPELAFSGASDLWLRFFRDGRATVRELGRGYGLLDIEHPRAHLARSVLMVGFIERAMRMAGARDVEVRLTKAAALGDGLDSLEVSWSA